MTIPLVVSCVHGSGCSKVHQRATVALILILLLNHLAEAMPSDLLGTDHPTAGIVADLLADVTSWQAEFRQTARPFVTITFAQSLDGKVALKGGSSNLILSCDESLLYTHGLRSIHDAILIGGRTLEMDNPRLSNRLWGTSQPRPVVLDPSLTHIRALASNRRAKNPIVCCSYAAAESFPANEDETLEVLPCECSKDGRLDLRDVLEKLHSCYNIQSIMLEGGASLISAFMSLQVMDCLCITVAPKLIGNNRGLAYVSDIDAAGGVSFINLGGSSSRFVPMGNDCIFQCQWVNED